MDGMQQVHINHAVQCNLCSLTERVGGVVVVSTVASQQEGF